MFGSTSNIVRQVVPLFSESYIIFICLVVPNKQQVNWKEFKKSTEKTLKILAIGAD